MNFSLTQAASKTGFLKSKDRTPLFYRKYPHSEAKAIIVLVHGFGEHGGRYQHVIDRLLEEKFEILVVDLRGHGHSEGLRGDVKSFGSYEDDVVAGIEYALRFGPKNKKLFLLAHSMGALISLRVATSRKLPLDGMVLSCPLLKLTMSVPIWKKWASIAVAKVLPKTKLSSRIKGNQLSKDQAMAQAYDADPLVLKNLSVRTFCEIVKACEQADGMTEKIGLPFFMQIGGKDRVVDAQASERWFSRIDGKRVDATLKVYPDLLHEIYNETERDVPIEDAIRWLNQHV